MCQQHRNSMECIIPDFMIEKLLKHKVKKVREAAQRTLATSALFRTMRTAIGKSETTTKRFAGVSGGKPNRSIIDCEHSTGLSGRIVRKEGDGPTGVLVVDEAYDGLGATYDLFWKMFQRDSIDGNGMPLIAFVHSGVDYNAAFWDGQELVFGDGDGVIFNRFTIAIDVIGHELAHGVTDKAGGLDYSGQSGALNESLSDVFGSMVKQYALGEQTVDQADWLIGAGLLIGHPCVRSMKDPHEGFQGGQPKHMKEYVNTNSDNGGVHINSGIPNYAFFLAVTSLGGHAWDHVGKVWYDTLLSDKITHTCTFQEFANASVFFAKQNHGDNSAVHSAVWNAWDKVGITAVDKPSGDVPETLQPPTSTLKADLQAAVKQLQAAIDKIPS